MKGFKLVIIFATALLLSCGVTRRPTGYVVTPIGTRYYVNSSINFSSELHYMGSIASSGKYIGAGLPAKYKTELLGKGANNQKEILYSIKHPIWSSFVVATVSKNPIDTTVNLFDYVNLDSLPSVNNYSSQWLTLKDGDKVLFYRYSVFKNRQTAYDVISFHKIVSGNKVVSISHVQDYDKVIQSAFGYEHINEVPYSDKYVIELLFKKISQ